MNLKYNSNCALKISSNSKISILNGKGINITTNKGNIKPTIEPESCIPPRVPEVVHPVPPPVAPKMPVASTETKKLVTINKPTPIVNIQKVPINRQIPVSSTADQTTSESSSTSISISSLSSDIVDSRDINELLNYIEGNKSVDKVALAQKKADKKARQRMKKVCVTSNVLNLRSYVIAIVTMITINF